MDKNIDVALGSLEVVRSTVISLNAEYKNEVINRNRITDEITRLKTSSVPPSDMKSFLSEYIDVKANEYLDTLQGELNELVYPNRRAGITAFDKRKPINFEELEMLLKDGGEEILDSKYDSTPATGRKMLDLFSIGSHFDFGRAFCFYFGKQMKETLGKGDVEFPEIPDKDVDPSTRKERRVLIGKLTTELSVVNGKIFEITSKMKKLGALSQHDGGFLFGGARI